MTDIPKHIQDEINGEFDYPLSYRDGKHHDLPRSAWEGPDKFGRSRADESPRPAPAEKAGGPFTELLRAETGEQD